MDAVSGANGDGRMSIAEVTKKARLGASESLEKISSAMEFDERADEACRQSREAEKSGDRAQIRQAHRQERLVRREARRQHRAATRSARQAYDAIKFSEPNRLGLMRFVQVGLAIHIALTLILLLLTSRDEYVYSLSGIASWVLVLLEGMAFWAFVNRYKAARMLMIIVAVLTLGVDAVIGLTDRSLSLASFVKDGIFYLLLIAYFLFSGRVRSQLVNDLSVRRPQLEDEQDFIARRGWPRVRNLVIYFIVFSILGHWMEMAMCQLIRLGLVEGEYDPTNTMLWRDWLYPFPMEGAAVVIIALVLYPLYQWLKERTGNPVLAHIGSFVANAFACSVIEFGMGLIVNANHELWDYSNNFGNIMGQVCLQNALAFGAAASIITWFVYPMIERWISRQPSDYMNVAFVATLLFGGIIWSLYIVEPPQIGEGTLASGSYTSASGKTEATFSLTGGDDESSDHPEGLSISVDAVKSSEDELAELESGAKRLREQLMADDSLTEEQRSEVLTRLDALDENLRALETAV